MVLMEMSIFPMGTGDSVSSYVARCIEVIRGSGLDYELHAMGTIVEGELPQVLEVMQKCFDALAVDCDRISCTAKLDYRRDRRGRIRSKVASVESKLQPTTDQ
jgi:uncharacterized protein (TIGR00106 family)